MVSVVIANRFHREAVEGLLAAGKHVLCEKPLADTLEAEAMALAARNANSVARVGFTFRRTPQASPQSRTSSPMAPWARFYISPAVTGPTTITTHRPQ